MRGWQTVGIVVVLMLAGCSGPEDLESLDTGLSMSPSSDVPSSNETEPSEAPGIGFFEGASCRGDMGVVPVPWSEVASRLPEGYRPMAIDSNLDGRVATVGILYLDCEGGRNATRSFDAHTMLWHWVVVHSPQEYDDTELANRLFPLHVAVSSEDVRSTLLEDFGQDSTVAQFAAVARHDVASSAHWRGFQSSDGPWSYDWSCYEAGSRAPTQAFRVRSFVWDGAEVTGWVDFAVNAFQSNTGGYTARYAGTSPFAQPSLAGLCGVYQWSPGEPAYNATFAPLPSEM